jgi:hypothetical protein
MLQHLSTQEARLHHVVIAVVDISADEYSMTEDRRGLDQIVMNGEQLSAALDSEPTGPAAIGRSGWLQRKRLANTVIDISGGMQSHQDYADFWVRRSATFQGRRSATRLIG